MAIKKKKVDKNLPVEPAGPPTICGVAGCFDPVDRLMEKDWLCKKHADESEASHGKET